MDSRVHAAAERVLGFWLHEVPPERRFKSDPVLDTEIAARFAGLRDDVLQTHAAAWRDTPRTLLAAVILLDQFSRNLHRDDPRAYAGDPLARALARFALVRGWGEGMTVAERQFLHMPFMHSERMDDQVLAVRLFGPDDPWAPPHAAQVARFGRFPQRNLPLRRASSAAEQAFLAEPGSRF